MSARRVAKRARRTSPSPPRPISIGSSPARSPSPPPSTVASTTIVAANKLTIRTLRAERLVLQTHSSPEELCRHFVFVQGQEEREAAFAMRQRLPPSSATSAIDLQAMFKTRRASIVRTWAVRHTMAIIHHEDVALAAGAMSASSKFDLHSRTSADSPVPPAMVTRALESIRQLLAATEEPVRNIDIVAHLADTFDRRFAGEWRPRRHAVLGTRAPQCGACRGDPLRSCRQHQRVHQPALLVPHCADAASAIARVCSAHRLLALF
jgi:hypothetical protein